MAKPDYSKAEKGFDRSAKAHKKYLLIKSTKPNISIEEAEYLPSPEDRKRTLQRTRSDIRMLKSHSKKIMESLQTSLEEIDAWIEGAEALTLKEWKKINFLRYRMLKAKEELIAPKQQEKNKEWVEKERVDHINKRHKIKDGWWPV